MRNATGPKTPSFAWLVQQFFAEYLVAQRALSPCTVACYRDALMLFLGFAGRKLGAFRGIEIVKRDGVGQYGGRVHNLKLIYAQGSVAMTSGEFLRAFALRSTLFDAQVVEKVAGTEKSAPDTTVIDGTRTSPDVLNAGDAGPSTTKEPPAKAPSAKSASMKSTPARKSGPTTTVAVEPPGSGTKVQAGSKARTSVDPAATPTTTAKASRSTKG